MPTRECLLALSLLLFGKRPQLSHVETWFLNPKGVLRMHATSCGQWFLEGYLPLGRSVEADFEDPGEVIRLKLLDTPFSLGL